MNAAAEVQRLAALHSSDGNTTMVNRAGVAAVLDSLVPGALKPSALDRFMRLAAASAAGKPCGQTTLALDHSTKDRAREIDVPTAHAANPPDIAAAELANFVLARVLGNEESALDCIQQDLWPRVQPKLQGEEEKASFGSAMPQLQTPPGHYALMLELIQPPLDSDDTFVESRCGTGHLIVQTRLATSAGRVVGVDVTKSRHKVALEAHRRIADCGNATSDLGAEEGCPASMPALADGDLGYLRGLSDGMEFALARRHGSARPLAGLAQHRTLALVESRREVSAGWCDSDIDVHLARLPAGSNGNEPRGSLRDPHRTPHAVCGRPLHVRVRRLAFDGPVKSAF